MADNKISALTAIVSIADADLFAIVDTSATETKKGTYLQLKTALATDFSLYIPATEIVYGNAGSDGITSDEDFTYDPATGDFITGNGTNSFAALGNGEIHRGGFHFSNNSTFANKNTTWGLTAGDAITTGEGITLIGHQAGQGVTSGSSITVVGYMAASVDLGTGVTAFGSGTLQNSTGGYNTGAGTSAGRNNAGGVSNFFAGAYADTEDSSTARSCITGDYNVVIGGINGTTGTAFVGGNDFSSVFAVHGIGTDSNQIVFGGGNSVVFYESLNIGYTTGGAIHSTYYRTTTPEGAQVGTFGDICYVNTGAAGAIYLKTTASPANTGWVALATGGGSGIDDVLAVGQALTADRTIDLGGFNLLMTGGNVGIGTVAPTVPLEVVGGAILNGSGASGVTVGGALSEIGDLFGGGAGTKISIDDNATTITYTATTSHTFNGNVDITNILTVPNTGLHVLDINASHDLIFKPGSDLSADRTLTITTGDADRTLTLAADATISGTNTGDQTSIVGISGTKAQFDTACSDGNFLFVGDVTIASLGLDADLATFAVPASTTISAFGATLVDDADAATARATLGITASTDQAYGETVTWTGSTAPSGATSHRYHIQRWGKVVNLIIRLEYATAGSGLTDANIPLPSGAPAPLAFTGAGSNEMYQGCWATVVSTAITNNPVASRAALYEDGAGGYTVRLTTASTAAIGVGVMITYFTA